MNAGGDMDLNLYPWDNQEKAYWINPENGLEWYVDQSTTRYCKKKKLKAIVFIVAERKEGNVKPLERVLIDKKTNKPIASETSLEAMAIKIDMLSIV